MRLVARDAATAEATLAFVLARLDGTDDPGACLDAGPERARIAGVDAWFKSSGLRGGARVRWTARAWCGGRLPREREFANLTWLAQRLFEVPVPLAAGRLERGGAPCWQFLVTRHELGARPLDAFLAGEERAARGTVACAAPGDVERAGRDEDERAGRGAGERAGRDEGERAARGTPDRRAVLEELAREVARFHALGFRHGDLYARNVLVRPAGAARRVVFLDAWAGGPPPHARPLVRDVADLLVDTAAACDADEARAFVAAYVAGRAAQGRPVDPRVLADVVRRTRGAGSSADERGSDVVGS